MPLPLVIAGGTALRWLAVRAIPFAVGWLARGGGSVIDKVAGFFPIYEEETVVSVYGNSRSKLGDLFNQAVAIAFGQTKNVFLASLPTPFVADAQYDMMHKSVTVTLRYMFNGIMSQLSTGISSLTGGLIFNPKFVDRFFSDPPSDNISGGLPNNVWFSSVFSDANNAAAQKLQVVCSSPLVVGWGVEADILARKPRNPNGVNSLSDYGSRGTFLERLVLSAFAVDWLALA